MTLHNLPELPISKQYSGNMTPEQEAFNKYIQTHSNYLSPQDEIFFKEVLDYYIDCIQKLKQINLSNLSDTEAISLTRYIRQAFNVHYKVYNDLFTEAVFRVSIVRENFCHEGKVREIKYLTYPPLDLNEQRNVYNRANSPNKTVMYASLYKIVAIRETKPQIGEKIIISTWENVTFQPFISYPLTNANLIRNEGVYKSTKSFQDLCKRHHPLIAEIMDRYLAFFAEEFVKNIPIISERKYEYLYSAFFANCALESVPIGPYGIPNIDLLIYPSVAWNHRHDNLALTPDTVENKLKLTYLSEYEILETFYEKNLGPMEMPVKLRYIRNSKELMDGKIFWNDD
ncbi:MAG TPA: hypothetical protein VK809_07220 [Bacteroidia bacterium]|jgi:hypothetical protein|nr:hypothetical protein [Bacteroidia bacterium]